MFLSSYLNVENKYSTMRSHDFLNEDWQKANKSDKTDGMSQKSVNSYRRENPGSKLKTAVTTDPSKLKKGSEDSKRRKSFCARSNGQKKMHDIDCSSTPDKAICKARRRWNCEEDIQQLEQALAEATFGTEPKRPARPGSRPARGHSESQRYSTGPVEAHGYAYNKRDQRIMFTKDFNSEQEAKEWARRNRATIIEIHPISVNSSAQETNLPEISKPALGRYIKAAGKDIEQRASSQSFASGRAGDKYNKADTTHQDTRREKGIDRALSKLTRENQGIEEELTVQSDNRYSLVDTYKNYSIYVTKQPVVKKSTGEKYFIGVTQVGKNEFKAAGPTSQDALTNVKNKIDELLNASTKVTAGATLDFNVKFATDILSNPREEFFAKVANIDGQPKLIIAGDEMLSFGKELVQLGFKPSALRIDPQTEKGTPLPSISYSKNQIVNTGLIANGRYEIGNMAVDKDGNKVFDLTYHSTAHTKSDKMRLNKPALTVGTTRIAESSNTLSWSNIDSGLSVEEKLIIFEEYFVKGTLKESNAGDTMKYFNSLSKLSNVPVVGQHYIVVPLILVNNSVMTLDTPQRLEFMGSQGKHYMFKGSHGTKEYPSKELRNVSVYETFTFLNSSNYNKFKTALALKFNVDLPEMLDTPSTNEECAGVGIVTKQNSTADVGPGTIGKNLKAFKLAQEGHNDDDYVQQLTNEFIRRAKLGRRYTTAENILGMLDRFFKKFAVNDRYFDDVFHRVVRTTDHEAGILEMETDLEEWKASRQLCRSSTPDKDLGASALASCKSQGLRARDGNKSHKLGKSPKSRVKVGGHRIKGKKYGGPIPDWSE